MSIFTRMFLVTFFFTIIPLIITGALIIYTYQDLIDNLLFERGIGLSREVIEDLSLALQNAEIQVILTVFIITTLTVFISFLMSRNLINPLRKLVKGTDEIAKGNLDFEIKIESKDEFGELSTHFNEMTQQLREMKMALEEAKTTLEIRVIGRTRELEELTKSLDGQVRKRTEELREKIQELEKFQDFAVGREIKMVELKEQIKKLKKHEK